MDADEHETVEELCTLAKQWVACGDDTGCGEFIMYYDYFKEIKTGCENLPAEYQY